jgi:hypothetical protein
MSLSERKRIREHMIPGKLYQYRSTNNSRQGPLVMFLRFSKTRLFGGGEELALQFLNGEGEIDCIRFIPKADTPERWVRKA